MIMLCGIEEAVLDKLLAGDELELDILREQRERLKVKNREFTGVGFFTTFEVPHGTRRLNVERSIRFGDVVAEIPGMKEGAGFLLFVDRGVITMLEGYSNANEEWPKNVPYFKVNYLKRERDIHALLLGLR